MDRFVFDRVHSRWVWHCVDDKNLVVKRCDGSFAYYLDCVQDAKLHGFNGKPFFMRANGTVFSPSFAPMDKGDSR